METIVEPLIAEETLHANGPFHPCRKRLRGFCLDVELARAVTIAVVMEQCVTDVLPHHATGEPREPSDVSLGRAFRHTIEIEVDFLKAERPPVSVEAQRCAVKAEIALPYTR